MTEPRRRALVVDDQREIRRLLCALLSDDFECEEADSAAAALDAARMAPPDVVLLDLRLPDGRGEEVVRELRRDASTASVAIVVVTGADHPSASAAVDADIDGFVLKPFEEHDLQRAVRNALDRRRGRPAPRGGA